ncbi:MAG: M23 family metallopeptidase [Myxococcales bacterium]|nr:M23 family metallopeptidase [Myxococcales bacterium]
MPRNQVTKRRRTSPWSGTLRLAAVFALLIAVNVYYFLLRGGTSISELQRISAEKGKTPAALLSPRGAKKATRDFPGPARGKGAPDAVEVASDDEGRVAQGVIGSSDTLAAVLKREEIPAPTLTAVVEALTKVFDPRAVRAGHAYALRFDGEDRLRTLEYRTTPATLFRVERKGEGWRAARETAELETRVAEAGGVIESSLYEAVKRSGEGTALVAFFVDLFAWDINFYIDTHAGDRFKVVVEKLFLDGKFYKYGRVLGAEYAGRAGTFRAFWFEPSNAPGSGGYFNERGESIVKSLLKTPLKYVRISSGFDRKRFHPVLHSERAHLGVDYAAPTGTPVWATAGGRVTFKGPRGGAGNCVMVAHPGGMESIYMHLSKFAKGLEAGETVRQKQVIGYVGATGLATGPHLHFSVKMGGHFVDPLRLKPARAAPLPPEHRGAFRAALAPRLEALARVEVHTPPKEAARGPSQPQ